MQQVIDLHDKGKKCTNNQQIDGYTDMPYLNRKLSEIYLS